MRTFNKTNVDLLRADLNRCMDALEKKHGVKFNIGAMRYSSTSVTFKTEGLALGNDDSISCAEEANYNAHSRRLGLPEGSFGKTFRAQGESFTICALKTKNHRYPVIAKNIRGQMYKFSADQIRMYL